jgi:hypothetical protein
MNTTIRMLAAALLFAQVADVAVAQRPPVTVLEGAVETVTDRVLFPSTLFGRIQVSECKTCTVPLQLDKNTRFILAGHGVSLKEMTAYASANPGKAMTINYRLSDSIVSLVLVLER